LLNDTEHAAIEGFRESGKSNYVLRAFMLYALMFPSTKRDYIVIIKANTTLARKVLQEIETEAETNPIISANCSKVLEQSKDVYSVDRVAEDSSTINIRIEVYGKGASIRGLLSQDRRPKIVVVDDPQDLVDATSETVSESDWVWFLSDVVFLGQKTRIFLIGNNLGEKCIIERIFNAQGSLEHVKFKTMRVPEITPQGKAAWRAKRDIEIIEQEKHDYDALGKLDIWLREKMCLATSIETQVFHDTDYRYFAPSLIEKHRRDFNPWATLDPAFSKKQTSCYRALTINFVDQDNNWFIPEIAYGRWDSYQMMEVLFDKVKQYRLQQVGIEKGEYKAVIEPFLLKEMSKRNIFFNIIELEHAKIGSKLERIKMLQPRFKAHTIWFPYGEPEWLTELKAELKGSTKDAIKS